MIDLAPNFEKIPIFIYRFIYLLLAGKNFFFQNVGDSNPKSQVKNQKKIFCFNFIFATLWSILLKILPKIFNFGEIILEIFPEKLAADFVPVDQKYRFF